MGRKEMHMPTLTAVMSKLKRKGKEQTRKIYTRHGMDPERVYASVLPTSR
jgi:hypothetical protein